MFDMSATSLGILIQTHSRMELVRARWIANWKGDSEGEVAPYSKALNLVWQGKGLIGYKDPRNVEEELGEKNEDPRNMNQSDNRFRSTLPDVLFRLCEQHRIEVGLSTLASALSAAGTSRRCRPRCRRPGLPDRD